MPFVEETKNPGKVAVKVNLINFEDLMGAAPTVVTPIFTEPPVEKIPIRTIFNPPPSTVAPTSTFASLPAKKMTRIPGAPKPRMISFDAKRGKPTNGEPKFGTSL